MREANAIAHETWAFSLWAAKALDSVVCIENPAGSYIWPFFESLQTTEKITFQDAVVSQCLYGAPYRKDTRFRLWNAPAVGLQDQCTNGENGHTCGREKHMILEFQGLPTGTIPPHATFFVSTLMFWVKNEAPADASLD